MQMPKMMGPNRKDGFISSIYAKQKRSLVKMCVKTRGRALNVIKRNMSQGHS